MEEICPKCGSPLAPVSETATGKRLQRCSTGSWNSETKTSVGCDYVKWLDAEPEKLDEKCPKCGEPLVLVTTRSGKKMKKCSTSSWNKEERKAEGCDYIEWINGTTEPLEEICPDCGEKLVLYTTAAGKKMKKCSTAGWDRESKMPTGCKYVEWLQDDRRPRAASTAPKGGDEFFPPEE